MSISSNSKIKITLPASLPNLKNLIINNRQATLTSVDGYKKFILACPSFQPHDYDTDNFLSEINRRINLPPSTEPEACCCQ